jgi:hypothetical protein
MLGTDGDAAGREVRALFPLINRRTIRRATASRSRQRIFERPSVPRPNVDSISWGGIIPIRTILPGQANLTASTPGRGTAM